MEILVLGGTQFVGRHLVNALLSTSHRVSLFNRGSGQAFFPEVTCYRGDREKGDFSALAGRRWDTVVDVPYFRPPAVQKAIDSLYPSTQQYIFISTVSVHDVGQYPDTWYDQYARDKVEEEAMFQDKAHKTLILRPGILCGSWDNTDRFDYQEDGIFWKGTQTPVEQHADVRAFAQYIVQCIEQQRKGVIEYVENRATPASFNTL